MKKLSVDHLLGIKYLKEEDIHLIFETADHLIPQSSKLCDNAQKVVCAQGPLWRLSLMSQTIHTASALEILYARRATLRLLELSKNNSARLVKALNGDVSNIFKVCQLLVASSSLLR